MTPDHTETQDFRHYLRGVWRWKFLVLALLIVVPVAAYSVENRKEPAYRSSALVRPEAVTIDQSLFPTAVGRADSIYTVARLVQTRTIADAAGRLMRPPESGAAIRGLISVEPDIQTDFLTISATSADPRRAAEVANAFAGAISANRTGRRIAEIDTAVGALKRQLEKLPRVPQATAGPTAVDPQRNQITDQIQRLRTLRDALRSSQGILEEAVPSGTPVGRDTRRAIMLGVVIALLLSAGAVAIAESSDRKLRSPEDLEDLTGLPLLSAIPISAFGSQAGDERDEEAFQMLRASLTYFNVDRSLTSVVVASAGQQDGKTTVAIRLAYALARAGSRVILVDADLRHPRVAARLKLPLTDGLAAVLAGSRSVSETLIDIAIWSEAVAARGGLKLLPAGRNPPNPGELLGSPKMASVLGELEYLADVVVIDSAAALAVSDTLPLLRASSGVVLVARMNRSTKAAVRRLQQVTVAASGTILGVVATGASARSGYEYGYAPAPKRRKRGKRAKPAAQMRPPKPEVRAKQHDTMPESAARGGRGKRRERQRAPEPTARLGAAPDPSTRLASPASDQDSGAEPQARPVGHGDDRSS